MKSFKSFYKVNEGGAYGGKEEGSHLKHPFDDRNLTFGDYKVIVDRALQGHLDKESFVWEKVDGQALSISWKDGRLIGARNHGHIKNFGENALDTRGIFNMFKGRGVLQKMFTTAMRDMEKAIGNLSDKQREKIFAEGKKWMALEVIYSKNENVIPYDKDIIIFHGTFDYDESGRILGEMDKGDASKLSGMLKQINQNVQKTFQLDSSDWLKIPGHTDFSTKKLSFYKEIEKLQKQFRLSDSDRIVMWHLEWWKKFIRDQARKMKYKIPQHVLEGLIRRWALMDKSFTINKFKKEIDNDKFLEWMRKFDKENHQATFKKNMFPFEMLFLRLGMEVMKNMATFLSANPGTAAEKIRDRLEADIKKIKASKDIKKLSKLDASLKKIQALGGMDAILPTEGLLFFYRGKIYKLTGIFAPVNQLLGLMTFG